MPWCHHIGASIKTGDRCPACGAEAVTERWYNDMGLVERVVVTWLNPHPVETARTR